MELDLAGRTVLISGGSKGIGLGIARRFAAEGCNLVLVAGRAAALEEAAAASARRRRSNVRTLALDLSDQAQRDKLVAACPDIDILVNNAGAIPGGDIVDGRRHGVAHGLGAQGVRLCQPDPRLSSPLMKERKRGVIINICGAGGETLSPGYIAGAAGNASLMAFSRALGGTSIDFGIRVVAVNPGPVETDRVVYLAKERAKRVHGDESRWREALHSACPMAGRPRWTRSRRWWCSSPPISRRYISGTVVTIDGGIALATPALRPTSHAPCHRRGRRPTPLRDAWERSAGRDACTSSPAPAARSIRRSRHGTRAFSASPSMRAAIRLRTCRRRSLLLAGIGGSAISAR